MATESSVTLVNHDISVVDYSKIRTNESASDLDSPVHSCNEIISGARSDEDDDIFDEVKMILRKRRAWDHADALSANDLDLLGDDDVLAEDEDEAGCPLPSTPEDTQLIEAEVNKNKCFCYTSHLNIP